MQPVTQPRHTCLHAVMGGGGGGGGVEIYTMEPWDTSSPMATADAPLES
jgi:hypothetical protein